MYLLIIDALIEQEVRKFVDNSNVRIRSRAQLRCNQWIAPAQIQQFGPQAFNLYPDKAMSGFPAKADIR